MFARAVLFTVLHPRHLLSVVYSVRAFDYRTQIERINLRLMDKVPQALQTGDLLRCEGNILLQLSQNTNLDPQGWIGL